jgi:sortase A
MRLRKLALVLLALAMVAVISACGSLGQSSSGDSGNGDQAQKEQPEEQQPEQEVNQEQTQQVAPQQGPQEDAGETANALEPPEDTTLKLTVPKMAEIQDDEIPTGLGNQEPLFRDYAAVHLQYTGWPWEEEANVYIAGHLMGYENTPSYRAFYDLDDLKRGDEIYITDAEGRQYTYEVFNKFVVEPTNLAVLAPIEGKNIVTLQTCTPPDYTDRFLVRGKLVDVKEA